MATCGAAAADAAADAAAADREISLKSHLQPRAPQLLQRWRQLWLPTARLQQSLRSASDGCDGHRF